MITAPAQGCAESRAPVFSFDIYRDPQLLDDVHGGWLRVKQEAPPVFWTPDNGGHWIANTAASVIEVLRHPEVFSSRFLSIPPNPNQPHMIPESLDPPEHRPYRQLLRPFFESKAIEPLEHWIIDWTNRLIDKVIDKGECEFVEALGSRLPVSVFMEMFGFPLERFEEFRSLVTGYFAAQASDTERGALAGRIQQVLAELIRARQAEPKDDLVSRLAHIDFEGRKLSFEELMSIGFLMFLAGLDTVTVAMTFGMRHLAHDEKLRARIIDDPACIPNAVEELLRRYAFVATPRQVTRDTLLEGAQLKAGDMISCPLMAVGWDAGLNPDPLAVSVDRPAYRHAAFGSGIHTCLGLHLARLELATFYRIWFERIGHFREVEPGVRPKMRGGSVMAMESLHLAWDRRA
ncbi:MAG: cytochrome P450 [Sandarakinorhabdus sp.]|nr:cytochrome P450 [Sandarakinorhabdus sp.]